MPPKFVAQFYMTHDRLAKLYDLIKKNKWEENPVDNFWKILLEKYFDETQGYYIAFQRRARDTKAEKKRVDITLSVERTNKKCQKLILLEDKKHSVATRDWGETLRQLKKYMLLAQGEHKRRQIKETVYGMINVGTYTRFYQLEFDATSVENLPGTDQEQPYELRTHEKAIHEILMQLADIGDKAQR